MLRDVFRTRASAESQCSRIAAPSAALAGRGRSGGALLPRRRRGRSPVRDEAPRAVGLPRPEREVFAVEAVDAAVGTGDAVDGLAHGEAQVSALARAGEQRGPVKHLIGRASLCESWRGPAGPARTLGRSGAASAGRAATGTASAAKRRRSRWLLSPPGVHAPAGPAPAAEAAGGSLTARPEHAQKHAPCGARRPPP